MRGRRVMYTLVLGVLLVVTAMAATPHLIGYQGRLTDAAGDPVADGARSVRFTLWNDPTAALPANEVWNSGVVSVTTTNGLFSVNLGQSPMTALDAALFTDTALWLGITVGADPEISPRTRLTAAPYSMATADRYVNEEGDTITGSTYWTFGSDAVDASILQGGSGGGYLTLRTNGESRAVLHGDSYGSLYLYNSDNNYSAGLIAQATAGGKLEILSSQADSRAVLTSGCWQDTCGPLFVMKNGFGDPVVTLDVQRVAGNAAVMLPASSISAGEIIDEPGVGNSESSSFFTFSSGPSTTYTVDSVDISLTYPGYVIVEVGGYLNLYHTNGTATILYVKSDKTAGTSSLSPGAHVVRIPDTWPSTGSYSAGYPIHSSRLYHETTTGSKRYYLNVTYSSGVSSSSNLGYRFIRATYYPTLYGDAALVSMTENGGPGVMMGDPTTTEMPSTTEVITLEEHNAQVEAALAEQREAVEERLRAIEEEMRQLREQREADERFGR